jgi:ATP-dependent helicase Lhr and Lhr-like helicase
MEQLQGLPLPRSVWETEVLPRRITGYQPHELDKLCVAGELVWRGFEPVGNGMAELPSIWPTTFLYSLPPPEPAEGELVEKVRDRLRNRGAMFIDELARDLDEFPHEVQGALWELVWSGELSNDTIDPLRSFSASVRGGRRSGRSSLEGFRSRRASRAPGTQGRWTLLPNISLEGGRQTERQLALANQLVRRYGLVTRSIVKSENIPGGFAGLYPVLKSLEESGKVRRGYFVAGLGGAQFAAPGVEHELRRSVDGDAVSPRVLGASDPANPYGAALPWPLPPPSAARPQRVSGARVILWEGDLVGFLGRSEQQLTTFLPAAPAERKRAIEGLVSGLVEMTRHGSPVYLTQVDGVDPGESLLGTNLVSVGFVATPRGYLLRAPREKSERRRGDA